MGTYTEYLDRQMDFEQLSQDRKKQLARISDIRGKRDILVFAADLNAGNAPIAINYSDLLPINDQLDTLKGNRLDIILESPGGLGEVVEDIVKLIRNKFEEFNVIIPGYAKSAATVLCMAADDILMELASSLGPIDAQIVRQGKIFSADALIKGMEKIKSEVEQTGKLNTAYIPILQGISPGELQSAQNALDFGKTLVTEWLATYKFKNWTVHSSTGKDVTEQDKKDRANEIASVLCDHQKWLTHGRSIKINDLEGMKLKITDYSKNADLFDAIRRYYTLLRMTFETNIYKIYETPNSQIYRFTGAPAPDPSHSKMAVVDIQCKKCNTQSRIQANFEESIPLNDGCISFPANNMFKCPQCGIESDLSDLRRQLEAQTKKKILGGS